MRLLKSRYLEDKENMRMSQERTMYQLHREYKLD
jgi:hypothetical protein